MDKNDFRILKELNSLKQRLPRLQSQIQEELKRIHKIELQRKQKSSQRDSDQQQLRKLHLALDEHESYMNTHTSQLEKAQKDIESIFSEAQIKALTTQINTAKSKLSEHESSALEAIDKIDDLEQKVLDATSFLKGSLDAIKEIEEDIKCKNAPLYKEINTLKSRIENLKNQLPEKVLQKLTYLEKKNENFNSISQITLQNTCHHCGYLMPVALVNSVENKFKFHTCPSCERILIPEGSKYY